MTEDARRQAAQQRVDAFKAKFCRTSDVMLHLAYHAAVPVALDVGRVVFQALNKVELMLLILMLILMRVSGETRKYWLYAAVLVLIMIAQSAWLLPELAARSASIVSGVEPPGSIAHAAYAVSEIAKLLTLLLLGFQAQSTRL